MGHFILSICMVEEIEPLPGLIFFLLLIIYRVWVLGAERISGISIDTVAFCFRLADHKSGHVYKHSDRHVSFYIREKVR